MVFGLWAVSPEERLIRYRDGVYDRVSAYENDLVNAPGTPCDQEWARTADKWPLYHSYAAAVVLYDLPWGLELLLDDSTMEMIYCNNRKIGERPNSPELKARYDRNRRQLYQYRGKSKSR